MEGLKRAGGAAVVIEGVSTAPALSTALARERAVAAIVLDPHPYGGDAGAEAACNAGGARRADAGGRCVAAAAAAWAEEQTGGERGGAALVLGDSARVGIPVATALRRTGLFDRVDVVRSPSRGAPTPAVAPYAYALAVLTASRCGGADFAAQKRCPVLDLTAARGSPAGGLTRALAVRELCEMAARAALLRRLLLVAWAVRIVLALAPGYVHPDGHFQCAQIAAADRSLWPWEWQGAAPCRSAVVPLALCFGAPWGVLAARLPTLALSFVADYLVGRAAPGGDVTIRLLFASAWPVMVFGSRPFSNTAEMLLLVALVAGAVPRARWLVAGALGSLGLWVRFTFAAFAAPHALDVMRSFRGRPGKLVRAGALVALGACVAGFALVSLDTRFFNSPSYVLTPLNSLAYNADPKNLAEHGLHPRFLHGVVNMPLLFGPLYLALLWRGQLPFAALFPLLALSLAPHQEPRFLLPLAPILALAWRRPGRLPVAWIAFNVVLAVFFGLLHQGGVLQALKWGVGSAASPATVWFVETYMAPQYVAQTAGAVVRDGSFGDVVAGQDWLVVPRSVDIPDALRGVLELRSSFWPHLSTENWPRSLSELALDVYAPRV